MSGASSTPCKSYTDGWWNCLKDCSDVGRSNTASKTCKPLAMKLDQCREEWRRKKSPPAVVAVVAATTTPIEQFDGTRVLPNEQCRPLSCQVQACIKWHQGDQAKCQEELTAVQVCMTSTQDQIVAPTEGDQVWSDYKKQ